MLPVPLSLPTWVVLAFFVSFHRDEVQSLHAISRRDWLVDSSSSLIAATGATVSPILLVSSSSAAAAERSETTSRWGADTVIVQRPPSPRNVLKTPTRFPSWLEGTWDVTQTLVSCTAPIGVQFLGGPNGDAGIGAASLAEARSRLNQPVQLQLRYVRNEESIVVEDRIFNTQSRLDAFAGRRVVSSVVPTRDTVTGRDDSAILVRFRGPAAQKVFVTGHHPAEGTVVASDANESWYGWESQRALFALTNSNTAPPVSTDTELLYSFQPQLEERTSAATIQGRLRIASFLNPNDRLYFDAQRQAVSLQDYTLRMERAASTL